MNSLPITMVILVLSLPFAGFVTAQVITPKIGTVPIDSNKLNQDIKANSFASIQNTAPGTEISDLLRQVIVAHYHAIEDNRLDDAMGHYHSQSPELVQTRENIALGLSQFLQKTATLSFCYVGRRNEVALAIGRHRVLMIMGIKFTRHTSDVVYQLRMEHGNWKIWTRRTSSNDFVKLMDCNQITRYYRSIDE